MALRQIKSDTEAVRRSLLSTVVALVCVLAFVRAAPAAGGEPTALDTYVNTPDAAYDVRLLNSSVHFLFRAYVLELTSQEWLTPAEVDRTEWKHWLTLYVPFGVDRTTAVLLINGGSNGGPQSGVNDTLGTASVTLGTVVADLQMVPNQPLMFRDESRQRSEDAIIAYSWDKYLRSGDERWPAQLPMTKAVVRAMDAITEFMGGEEGGRNTINSFVVAGGSKRGWASWLTAAVDERVIGVVPTVIDVPNVEKSLENHWQTYGFWAPAIGDYVAEGIMAWFGSAQLHGLLHIIDPYEYRDRLTMPKYIVNAAGDQFFVPTSSQFYYDDMPGEKYLRYIPNVSHSLEENPEDALFGVVAWAWRLVRGQEMPRYSWELPEDGSIRLTTEDAPLEVRMWQASNATARDFRVETIGEAWTSTIVGSSGDGVYEVAAPTPDGGWTAYFLEMTYLSGTLFPLKFTTPVRVTPEMLPFAPPLASTLAASFDPRTAAGAIASTFGTGLANGTAEAESLPLPAELAGTRVRVTDANGVLHDAQLFYVSPTQVNFLVPVGAAPGVANVEVFRDGNKVGEGQLLIDPLAPGIFSANGSGDGVAAAVALTVKANGESEWSLVFDGNQPEGEREAVGIDLGEGGDEVYLLLFGTGMRAASLVTAMVGGEPVGVIGPAPSSEFEGVDQVNLGPLPRSLAGRSAAEVVLDADGIPANVVTVSFH